MCEDIMLFADLATWIFAFNVPMHIFFISGVDFPAQVDSHDFGIIL